MPLSDNEIIDSIRKGDHRLYSRLVDRYKDKVMTLALRMLRDRRDAEEAAQDAFVRAYKALDKFEGTAKFGTWLYRIVYNVCLTMISKKKNAVPSVPYGDEDSIEGVHSSALAQDIELKDMIQLLKAAVDRLPGKYATILSLFYFQELSHEEICEVTQLPLGTVKVQLFRARAILHARVSRELSPEGITV